MLVKIKNLKFSAGRPIAMLCPKTAKLLDLHADERVLIRKNHKKIIAVVDIIRGKFKEREIAVSSEVFDALKAKENDVVEIYAAPRPESIEYITKKLDGKTLSYDEILSIIQDIVDNALTESEIAYFVSAVYIRNLSAREIAFLTKAIVETGEKPHLRDGIIADKHCIGGIAGNITSPIIVSICSAAGLIMPKSSSRAITSAAGTADVVETIACVEFSVKEMEKIIKKARACLVWGGALGLAPADDKIIQVERLIHIDPEAQILASIMAKKLSLGSTHVLIDIPYGKSAKVTRKNAIKLGKKFQALARAFKIKLKFVLTDGSQPIGNGVGPVLEMRDVLSVLRQDRKKPFDLEKKAVFLAGNLLELTGKVERGKGERVAYNILKNGKAYKKFLQIIKAQHGNVQNIDKKLKLGRFSFEIKAWKKGRIREIDNKKINMIARAAGAPADKAAGLYLFRHCQESVKKGEGIIKIYAENREKLKDAVRFFHKLKPVKIC